MMDRLNRMNKRFSKHQEREAMRMLLSHLGVKYIGQEGDKAFVPITLEWNRYNYDRVNLDLYMLDEAIYEAKHQAKMNHRDYYSRRTDRDIMNSYLMNMSMPQKYVTTYKDKQVTFKRTKRFSRGGYPIYELCDAKVTSSKNTASFQSESEPL